MNCYLSLNKENTIKTTKIVETYFDSVTNMEYKLFHFPKTSTTTR